MKSLTAGSVRAWWLSRKSSEGKGAEHLGLDVGDARLRDSAIQMRNFFILGLSSRRMERIAPDAFSPEIAPAIFVCGTAQNRIRESARFPQPRRRVRAEERLHRGGRTLRPSGKQTVSI